MRRGILLLMFAAVIALAATDISGTWNVTVEIQGNSASPRFVLKQDGEKLTGTYSGQLGNASITGTVHGDQVEWQFEAKSDLVTGTIRYRGKITGSDKMKGTLSLADLGDGTWEGTKQ